MKVTVSNLETVFPKIKDKLPEGMFDDAEYSDIVKMLPHYGKPDSKEITSNVDDYIDFLNEAIESEGITIPSGSDKPKEPKTPKEPKEPKTPKTPKEPKKPKAPKTPEVDVSGANTDFHRLLKKYINMAGTTKDAWRVYDYLLDIHGSCDIKLGNKTPFVELIQKIEKKLVSLYHAAEKAGNKKIEVPDTYKSEAENAIKKAGMSKSKTYRKKVEETTLSGADDWTSSVLSGCFSSKKKVATKSRRGRKSARRTANKRR